MITPNGNERTVNDMEMRICFEVSTTYDGEPCTFGIQMSLGEMDKAVDYERLANAVDIDKLISVACLDTLGVTKDVVRIITPEEYDRMYGDGDGVNGGADNVET